MEQNDLRPSDLLPILGSPGYVSDVTLGKRAISNLKGQLNIDALMAAIVDSVESGPQ